ncbi:CAP domain-containing protein [Hyphomicrobium sp.]|uniref:CAP domain-containing protein n=1 Tax=Hyphomicrobium sp. TaxID=82 RepID=UPI0025BBE25E|nr:CAP domain-containing protein [Hyphomicrobium sp.]MCC7250678.1 CAP domain-containing protein [Hyphomicrobium sp.]
MPAVLPDTPAVEAQIIEFTNAYRGRQNLGTLTANPNLTKAARTYAAFLAKSGLFSHTADGREAGDRITSAGYAWCQIGENLAMHLDSRGFEARALAEKSVEGWINSPPHRANLVAPHMTEIGVGVARAPDKDPKFISVQLFARPQSLSYEFQISNTTRDSVAYSFGGEAHEIKPRYAVTHSSCSPGEISFDSFGGGLWPTKLSMRYEARDGLLYRLEPDADGGVRVAVTPIERVR